MHIHLGPWFFPLLNSGEITVLYCFIFLFLYIVTVGPGAVEPGWSYSQNGNVTREACRMASVITLPPGAPAARTAPSRRCGWLIVAFARREKQIRFDTVLFGVQIAQ